MRVDGFKCNAARDAEVRAVHQVSGTACRFAAMLDAAAGAWIWDLSKRPRCLAVAFRKSWICSRKDSSTKPNAAIAAGDELPNAAPTPGIPLGIPNCMLPLAMLGCMYGELNACGNGAPYMAAMEGALHAAEPPGLVLELAASASSASPEGVGGASQRPAGLKAPTRGAAIAAPNSCRKSGFEAPSCVAG